MIECVITIDYEIYGNGEGSLKELVYEPANRLGEIFRKWNANIVVFVEVSELEIIEAKTKDPAIDLIKQQLRDFKKRGFELGLHLHPQWYNAKYENGRWFLDYGEYNLCALPRERIVECVDRSLAYLRYALDIPDYSPTSFRAGNWLFQPTRAVAVVLAERGIKVDSSVFKGGLQKQHKLDYRRALENGYYWRFSDNVEVPDPGGLMLELPTHVCMVPIWKMITFKRIQLQRKGIWISKIKSSTFDRVSDFLRFRHPLKFDFCRMSINELTSVVDDVIQQDQENPTLFRPIVAIGHTKDIVDYDTVECLLSYLRRKRIKISTIEEIYSKCK